MGIRKPWPQKVNVLVGKWSLIGLLIARVALGVFCLWSYTIYVAMAL